MYTVLGPVLRSTDRVGCIWINDDVIDVCCAPSKYRSEQFSWHRIPPEDKFLEIYNFTEKLRDLEQLSNVNTNNNWR